MESFTLPNMVNSSYSPSGPGQRYVHAVSTCTTSPVATKWEGHTHRGGGGGLLEPGEGVQGRGGGAGLHNSSSFGEEIGNIVCHDGGKTYFGR